MTVRILVAFLIGILLPQLFFIAPTSVFAVSEIDRLKNEINDRSGRLSEIEEEIAKFNSQLQEVGAEKKNSYSQLSISWS